MRSFWSMSPTPTCTPRKGTKFPLELGSVRARGPEDDLSLEKPVLLNPTLDDPTEELRFVPTTEGQLGGAVQPKTPRAESTIKMLKLNHRDLFDRRRKKQADVRLEVGRLIMTDLMQLSGLRQRLETGVLECSAAQLAQVHADTKKIQELLG